MNIWALRMAVALATAKIRQANGKARPIDMLLTVEVEGFSVNREDETTLKEGLKLFEQGKLRCDFVTLAGLLNPTTQHVTLFPPDFQEATLKFLKLHPAQIARLAYLAYWPQEFADAWRLAWHANDNEWLASVLHARVQYFIEKGGNEDEQAEQARASTRRQ